MANFQFKFQDTAEGESPLRTGILAVLPSLEVFAQRSGEFLSMLEEKIKAASGLSVEQPINVFQIAISNFPGLGTPEIVSKLESITSKHVNK